MTNFDRICCTAALAATMALSATTAEATLKIEKIDEAEISFTKKVGNVISTSVREREFSGITRMGDNLYCAVEDSDNQIYQLQIKIKPDGYLETTPKGYADVLISNNVPVSGANDIEGCAFDPASGMVWVSDETNARIREIDPNSGTEVRSAPVPKIMNNYVRDYSLESLTISGDGKTMWTCNEESLKCDDEISAKDTGSIVRLTKFTRSSVYDNWTASLQWAYLTEPIGTEPFISGSVKYGRSGVADLTALPNGQLLVLERDFCGENGSNFCTRIYLVDGSGVNGGAATDVSGLSSLKGATYKLANKKRLYKEDFPHDEAHHWRHINYEGMCLGPRLDDGTNSVALVLIADSGNRIMTLKLYDKDDPAKFSVRTLNVNNPSNIGTPSFAGQNYRFMDGDEISVDLLGVQPYTNNGDCQYDVKWFLNNKLSGHGTHAKFTITNDCTLTWNVTITNAHADTSIYAHDTFEDYAEGTHGSDIMNWTDGGNVIKNAYKPNQGANKYILNNATHTKVLDAQDGATRDLTSMLLPDSDKNYRMDIMVEILKPQGPLTNLSSNSIFAIAVDKYGRLNAWHTVQEKTYPNAAPYAFVWNPFLGRYEKASEITHFTTEWGQLSNTTYTNGTWVHVSAEFRRKSNDAFAKVWIDGKECTNVDGGSQQAEIPAPNSKGSWLMLPNSAIPTNLVVKGTMVDDFIIATPGFMQSLPTSPSIMVAPTSASGANGAAAAGGQAYTVTTAAAAPVAATASAPSTVKSARNAAAPAITGFGISTANCPRIQFCNYDDSLEYCVTCSSTIDFKNAVIVEGKIVGTKTSHDGKSVSAIWEGDEPCDPVSGAKFYRVSVAEATAE